MGRSLLPILGIGLALLAAACGGKAPTAPSAPSTTINGTVAAYGTSSHDVEMATGGTVTITLTWTANVDLDLYLTDNQCSGYPPDRCFILAQSIQSAGRREEITWPVKQQERYKIWVDNFSPGLAADYTIEVVVR